jgi:phosphoglycerol transferase
VKQSYKALERFWGTRGQIAVSTALLTLLAFSVGLKIWRYDLTAPLNYSGDALFETMMVKATSEETWNYYIPHLGAPFGMDALDFPVGMILDFSVIKLMSFFIHTPFLLINVFWVLTIVAAGVFAALFLRALQITPLNSIVFGTLYGIIPFVFYRNIGHLSLVHYILPAAAYLGLTLGRGEIGNAGAKDSGLPARRTLRKTLLFCWGLCAAIGLTSVYWGFFACIVVFLGTLIGFFRVRSKKRHLLVAASFIAVITITSLADVSASIVYWKKNGWPTSLNYKTIAEADIYGLKIRQLLSPIYNHPLGLFRDVNRKLQAAHFPNDDNESATAALGVIGSLGFLLLLSVAVAHPRRGILADSRLRTVAGLALGILLIATVGGFGSLFNVFVMTGFRAYNRISPLISLFSLAAAAIVLDAWTRRRAAPVGYGLSAAVLLIGIFDQADPAFLSQYGGEKARFFADREFIGKLETMLPAGAMIFQLPHTGFPPDGIHFRMGPYENARAYLNSHTLRWSWGAMDGRHENWAETIGKLPVPRMLEKLVASGFDGVLVDRFGYPNSELEQSLSMQLGTESNLLANDRWSFFDLRKRRYEFQQQYSAEAQPQLRDEALHPVGVEWLGQFSVAESSPAGAFRWCGRHGVIRFVNKSSTDRKIQVSGDLQGFGDGSSRLTITRDGTKRKVALGADPLPYRDDFLVKAHSATEIHFDFEGELLHAPQDSRELAFQLRGFTYQE